MMEEGADREWGIRDSLLTAFWTQEACPRDAGEIPPTDPHSPSDPQAAPQLLALCSGLPVHTVG